MKAAMSNIGKQESQNDYMHTHRRKKTSEHTLSLTPIFLQSLEKNACGCLQQTSNRIVQ
jgi:hypothetical protein